MIETKGLTGAQTLLRVLGGMGVERIFASPGSEWSPLWEALAAPPPWGWQAATRSQPGNCRRS